MSDIVGLMWCRTNFWFFFFCVFSFCLIFLSLLNPNITSPDSIQNLRMNKTWTLPPNPTYSSTQHSLPHYLTLIFHTKPYLLNTPNTTHLILLHTLFFILLPSKHPLLYNWNTLFFLLSSPSRLFFLKIQNPSSIISSSVSQSRPHRSNGGAIRNRQRA